MAGKVAPTTRTYAQPSQQPSTPTARLLSARAGAALTPSPSTAAAPPLQDVALQDKAEDGCWAAFKRCICACCPPEEPEDLAKTLSEARQRQSLLGMDRSPSKGNTACAIL